MMMFVKQKPKYIFLALLFGTHLMIHSGTSLDASTTKNSNSNPSGTDTLTDFTTATTDFEWFVQNDSVMGGQSEGSFKSVNGILVFTGITNTNGGGFSSIRTQRLQLDLSNHDGIRLQVKGDGRRYSWQLQTDATWRGRRISYWADFETRADEWNTVDIPFSGFKPRFRGRWLDGPDLERTQLTSMGLYIYDKQDGPFELYIANVSAYSDSSSTDDQ